jgi:hypothetical protein
MTQDCFVWLAECKGYVAAGGKLPNVNEENLSFSRLKGMAPLLPFTSAEVILH